MKILSLGALLTVLLFNGAAGYADSDFYWPQPDPPYQETEPFIEPVKSDLKDEEPIKVDEPKLQPGGLEDIPLRTLPLEDDPLLRTPLEERQEQEGLLPDFPQQNEPLPEHPLEEADNPLSSAPLEKKNLEVETLLAYASNNQKAIFSAVVEEKHLQSWVVSANELDSNFPIQNLPYGVFSLKESPEIRHIGVAIGSQVFDLHRGVEAGLFQHLSQSIQKALKNESLNAFMDLGQDSWHQVRSTLISILRSDNSQLRDSETLRSFLLVPQNQVNLHLPFEVGDFTDFYTSINHATNVGKRFRPQNPLLPNFKYLPVAYHGRASSVVVSGTPIRRPVGQVKKKDSSYPEFLPTSMLDYEMELGAVIGVGNPMGERIRMKDASKHIFGMVIINDWSARDVQKWEYQPLGPFNGKNFATSVSPWVVTMEALEPYHVPGPLRSDEDPETIGYLKPVKDTGLDITVEVWLSSKKMRDEGMGPVMVSQGNFDTMYWTIAQMVVHHTSTGANLRSGDLLGSGTISGTDECARGCLLELVEPGSEGLLLPDGTRRSYLEDGDEVILKAYSHREGLPRIGFGECCGVVAEVNEFDK